MVAGSAPSDPVSGGAAEKQRFLRLVSRFVTREEFLDVFQQFVDENSIFVATRQPLPAGRRQRIAIQLKTGDTMLFGEGEVIESPAHFAGPGSPLGMRLKILSLDERSRLLHRELLKRKRKKAQARPPTTVGP